MPSIATSFFPSETYLPEGANEELAGPPRAVAPVNRAERMASIDTLGGFALLGILVLNLDSFCGPEFFHDIPIGLPKPAFTGAHAHLSLTFLFIKWIFFEGKMRFLVSMFFGAGAILFTDRAERGGTAGKSADIFLRRNMWLIFFEGVLR
ncbi:hypothetical protein [Granulicella sp. L60]|uniref:hypothetical protein n=1 Tax=Granulicella sp. L60 TaxID=1641866 RepID=UPI00131DE4E9|nr:hypothetical protein [Granulicella sp. L60]